MRKSAILFLLSVAVLCVGQLNAQQYTADAYLVTSDDNVAVVRCSGYGSRQKETIKHAIKSAVYNCLFNGVEGLNNGEPILGRSPSDQAVEYANDLLSSDRYAVFVKGYTLNEQINKNIERDKQVVADVSIYVNAIYRELKNRKLIGVVAEKTTIRETQTIISLPSIMVVPYATGSDTYQSVLQKNADVRMAVAKVTEAFVNRGVETKDLEQSLRNANAYQATRGDMSLNDALVTTSGADVLVSVDMTKETTSSGTRVNLHLAAIEAANGKNIASRADVSARLKSSADVICSAMTKAIIDDFMQQISTGMASKINKGNSLAVRFTIDSNSQLDMDSEIGNDYTPLSDVLIAWVKKNAKDGKYHQQGRSSTLLIMDEINIANRTATGEELDVNDFALELYRFLRGLNLSVKRNIVGNTVDIIIL